MNLSCTALKDSVGRAQEISPSHNQHTAAAATTTTCTVTKGQLHVSAVHTSHGQLYSGLKFSIQPNVPKNGAEVLKYAVIARLYKPTT
jgi:hypothetical protein